MHACAHILDSGEDPRGPEVDSFYHLKGALPSGRPCDGTACFVAPPRHRREEIGAADGRERVYCLGRCFAAPAVVNGNAAPYVHIAARQGIVLERIAAGGARTLASYRNAGGYRSIQWALARPPVEIIAAIEESGLRGRGGAGFPTGRKWRAVADQPGDSKFVVANADEGDAGAYSDRILLEEDPHSLIEGMLLAGYATGASSGWVYVRGEYTEAWRVVRAAIDEARSAGLLGGQILGSDFRFDIDVCIGKGSYVCGEETALLRSIEGRRPEVAARPPYPTERGLSGRPTLVHNVETLVNVPWIAAHGGREYHSLGFAQSRGTKLVSLNSLCVRPGIYEVEFGVSVRHIVECLGGGMRDGALKGVIIGGPLAGIVPPHLLDTPFAFEELRSIGGSVGHGGCIVFDQRTSIVELVRHVFAFGAYESCGKCTPCRLGATRVEGIFDRVVQGRAATAGDWRAFQDVVCALERTSLCAHGGGLAEFADSVLRYYREELERCFT